MSNSALAANLHLVRARIAAACAAVGRMPSEVKLIAVTKTIPVPVMMDAVRLGITRFGESRLQEAVLKTPLIQGDVEWHFIGSLQSNKARKIAMLFDAIHSVDSPHQLPEIAKAGRPVDVCIQVNIANEPQKSGVAPDSLDALVAEVLNYPNIHLRGLMTIGPEVSDPEDMRPWFRKMRELLNQVPHGTWLSMGMTHDFDVAIQEGATHIRVGRALFGDR
ncbi:MAG: YggS family pyridoxal phosphate-dependent enzyme [Fimbriimonadaceae bacterium]